MDEFVKGLLSGSVFAAVVNWLLNYRDSKRKAHVSEITIQRIEWAKEVKGQIAEFITFIECYDGDELKTIKKTMNLLELNLNPLKDDFDEEYVIRLNQLYREVVKGENVDTKLDEFKDLSKRMVKIEWDGIKLESEKGNPSKQDKLKLRRKWLV